MNIYQMEKDKQLKILSGSNFCEFYDSQSHSPVLQYLTNCISYLLSFVSFLLYFVS